MLPSSTAADLPVLATGPRWVVVNKPAGIATEGPPQFDNVEARARVQWRRSASSKAPFVGIVHRLDRPVSGALLLARNKSTLVALNEAFARRQTQKTYWAVTEQPLPAESGRLVHYLMRDRTGRRAVASTRPLSGAKEAALDYRLLRAAEGKFLYELLPLTGRFHQLRVQLATVGCPIIGDAAYGSPRLLTEHGIALHARALAFPEPGGEVTAEEVATVSVVAPLPGYWPLGVDGEEILEPDGPDA